MAGSCARTEILVGQLGLAQLAESHVVIAGLGSIPGAVIAGILIGLSQGAATIWYPEATNVVVYLMMGLTIIFRPQGLFGTR